MKKTLACRKASCSAPRRPGRDQDSPGRVSFTPAGYDSRIGSGRRAFGSGYRRDDDYRGCGDRYEDRYDRRDDRMDRWNSRDDYGRDDFRREDRGNGFVGVGSTLRAAWGGIRAHSRCLCSFPGPTQRPKLNLKPRSAPKEEETSAAPAPQSSRAASIFGGAKPVDTAAREREVEERLQKEQEKLQRQLEDDKRIERRPRERWAGAGGRLGQGLRAAWQQRAVGLKTWPVPARHLGGVQAAAWPLGQPEEHNVTLAVALSSPLTFPLGSSADSAPWGARNPLANPLPSPSTRISPLSPPAQASQLAKRREPGAIANGERVLADRQLGAPWHLCGNRPDGQE